MEAGRFTGDLLVRLLKLTRDSVALQVFNKLMGFDVYAVDLFPLEDPIRIQRALNKHLIK